jgi:hypothetical protein
VTNFFGAGGGLSSELLLLLLSSFGFLLGIYLVRVREVSYTVSGCKPTSIA